MLDPACREFAEAFATRIIESDFDGAHRLLAPWLRQTVTPEHLRELIQKEVLEVAEANELDGDFHPSHFELDSNHCTLDNLKEDMSWREARPIPDEVTAENFRQWMVIEFMPTRQDQDELGIDAWLDWWMLVVAAEGEYRIGFFEIEDPD